ncbi:unnamed protein product [Pleuronectes platessa]|uniref:Uncharacterized protein n=1 Tax=Pleuronectes platessa TaxID=8262 RepID=A0A9N7UZ07_PLEPL|nr:unnamed protein product [Pleuronectes platessa]
MEEAGKGPWRQQGFSLREKNESCEGGRWGISCKALSVFQIRQVAGGEPRSGRWMGTGKEIQRLRRHIHRFYLGRALNFNMMKSSPQTPTPYCISSLNTCVRTEGEYLCTGATL